MPDHSCHQRCLFICYEVVSRLKSNVVNPKLVSIVVMDNTGALAHILGCKMPSHQMKYLGLPLELTSKAKSIWDNIIKKKESQLAGWKRHYLSEGGHDTLI